MNKEQYDALNREQKAIATEVYIDGFEACMKQVDSVTVKVGVDAVDNIFDSNKKAIYSTLESSLKKMRGEE